MKKKSRTKASESSEVFTVSDILLAQILLNTIGDGGQKKKALALKTAGLSNSMIGNLMGTSALNVGTLVYQARQERAHPKKSSRKRAAPTKKK